MAKSKSKIKKKKRRLKEKAIENGTAKVSKKRSASITYDKQEDAYKHLISMM